MSVHHLEKIFNPHRIAIIGASDRPGSVGYSVLRNLVGNDFEGVVYPVNHRRESVQGVRAYPTVEQVPKTPDLAIVCTPAATVPQLVRDCGAAGINGMIILTAGFREVGKAGAQVNADLLKAAAEYPELRIIGPNCLGVIVPRLRLNASFAATTPAPGSVALLSQSGALCTSFLDWAEQEQIGFSNFVSVGNMLDVSIADLIDFFANDRHTESIILYVEAITEAREFLSAARAFTRSKPIVVYKSGRFAESAKAAASHTGAMAGDDAVYDAAFERAGIVRAFDIGEIFDTAELLARSAPPRGPRLAIVTNAGGPGVIATDALLDRKGELSHLSHETLRILDATLPSYWSGGNPVDVLGDATDDRFRVALKPILADNNVDAVLVILTPQAMTDPTAIAQTVAEIAQSSLKPVLAAWMGGASVTNGIRLLNAASVPTYPTPEHAVRAFMNLVQYGRYRQSLYEMPRDVFVESGGRGLNPERNLLGLRGSTSKKTNPRPGLISRFLRRKSATGQRILSEPDAKAILKRYGIPVTDTLVATSRREAVQKAEKIGYPIVLKIYSPQITHKTDVGGVRLNLRHAGDVTRAFDQIVANAKQMQPDADVQGVTVQPMFESDDGLELIVGAKQDATFGTVMLVGTGGTAAECFHDRALGLPPLNERSARHMLESLLSWPLLRGYRGKPGADIDRLIEVLIRFSHLIADSPEIQEFDINPLFATSRGAVALDARIVISQNAVPHSQRPFAQLAIRPYPDQFRTEVVLNDGLKVRLRPIRPEDEPLWHAMLAACSPETIRARFRCMLKQSTHEFATRFCYIDYDREMGIVAEIDDHGERKLVGVGRLVADNNHDTAEFAVLVADPWQNKGLGSALTKYCLEVAAEWGLQTVVAETDSNNLRMLAAFRRRAFEVTEQNEGVVSLTCSVGPNSRVVLSPS